jgi:CzcA family heavy metal efflux pump
MTLGGLAIAIGELVDDSIVDVENIYRRLRENSRLSAPKAYLKVIFDASSEVRNSIVMATIIIALVFIPLFNLTGLEGKLFGPLAISYLTALFSSLLVSLTITPVLASYLLTKYAKKSEEEHHDTKFLAFLKKIDRKMLTKVLDYPKTVFASTITLLLLSFSLVPFMGQDFLPQFNEGSAMVGIYAPPGVSLAESNSIGKEVEERLMKIEEIKTISRRTGRAEEDEHAMGVNVSEIDINFHQNIDKDREAILNKVRDAVSEIEGVGSSVGQPLAHLIDHTLSGVTSQLAIKIFGPDLTTLRSLAMSLRNSISEIDGLVDLRVEQQALIPELKIYVLREEAAKYAISAGEISSLTESAFNGHSVTKIIEGQRYFDLFYRFDDQSRQSIDKMSSMVIKTMPDGKRISLEDVADIYETQGINEVSRENGGRRIVISANISGRDQKSVVEDVKRMVDEKVKLPKDYYVIYEGQFKAQQEAFQNIIVFGLLALIGIVVVLYSHFKSKTITLQIMSTIPFAFIGGITLLFLTDRTLTVASMVGFITLCGITCRNSIMMISHYIHLMKYEGEKFSKEMIIRGSLERLTPVLMTASVTALALLPLTFAKNQPGSEILYPVAIVVVGGLITSTLLDIIVTPVIFYVWGEKAVERMFNKNAEELHL